MPSTKSTIAKTANFTIRPLEMDEAEKWLDDMTALRGDEHLRRLIRFLDEMSANKRMIWVAKGKSQFCGMITVQYGSEYPPFGRKGIFEIVDVWVSEKQRKHGIGRALLRAAVDFAASRKAPAIGLGVGITADFGPAHRLYASEGFMPDGSGTWGNGKQLEEGARVTLNDHVIMMWVKAL